MRAPADLLGLVDDRPADGVFRVHRDAFRDGDVFAREMTTFFERNWMFVGHASQLPAPHDFMTLAVRGQPLVVMRSGAAIRLTTAARIDADAASWRQYDRPRADASDGGVA